MMFVVYPKTVFRPNEKRVRGYVHENKLTKKVSNPNKVVV